MKLKKELRKMDVENLLKIKDYVTNIFYVLNKYDWKAYKKTRDVFADVERELYGALLTKNKLTLKEIIKRWWDFNFFGGMYYKSNRVALIRTIITVCFAALLSHIFIHLLITQ